MAACPRVAIRQTHSRVSQPASPAAAGLVCGARPNTVHFAFVHRVLVSEGLLTGAAGGLLGVQPGQGCRLTPCETLRDRRLAGHRLPDRLPTDRAQAFDDHAQHLPVRRAPVLAQRHYVEHQHLGRHIPPPLALRPQRLQNFSHPLQRAVHRQVRRRQAIRQPRPRPWRRLGPRDRASPAAGQRCDRRPYAHSIGARRDRFPRCAACNDSADQSR